MDSRLPDSLKIPEVPAIEAKPAASEEVFRLLIDAVEDYAIFVLDQDGYVLTWSTGAQRLKGYAAKEIIGTHFSRFYTAEDIQRQHPAHELEIAAEVGKYVEEGWRLRKDGTRFWASVVITALRNPSGTLRGFGKVTRDLTEKRVAEQKLRESEERFRLMVESVNDYAIFMLDPQGLVMTWNKGAERNKGYSPKEILGQHFSKFYPSIDIASGKPDRELREAIAFGRFEEEGWRVRQDGTQFWASVIITPVYDATKKLLGFVKVTRNLTERKLAEDNLRRAYGDLERRVDQRTAELQDAKTRAEAAVKARDQFFSIASHELKTPLSSLRLQVQMRSRAVATGDLADFAPENLAELCADDERQVERLTFLVENMLDVSKLTSGSFKLVRQVISLDSLLSDSLRRLAPLLERTGNDMQLTIEKVDAEVDHHRIEQVVTNLLTNVSRYAPQAPVVISLTSAGDEAVLTVQDHGPGIPETARARIFKPFERAHEEYSAEGLGLGLFIVKQIIEAHAGRLEVESQLGEGSTFIVTLPLRAPLPA